MSENSQRQLVKIVSELCDEMDINLHKYSYDWILELDIDKKLFQIVGYKFPNNSAAISQLCDDKCGMFEVLNANGFPAVEHYFFMSPNNLHYIGKNGNWDSLKKLLNTHKELVLKPNQGSGGNNVIRVKDIVSLEKETYNLFRGHRSIAVSPYYPIQAEYRVIVLNGNAELAYKKERPYIIGDGIKTVNTLILEKYGDTDIEIDSTTENEKILPYGMLQELTWKHNLGKGAKPIIISDSALKNELTVLATSVTKTLQINFASVDIVKINNELRILEINSGIMMENFSKYDRDCYAIAKNIYKKAIEALFGGKRRKIYKHHLKKKGQNAVILPLLNKAADKLNVSINMDEEYASFCIYTFENGKKFVARDLPFNINLSGSVSLTTNKAATTYFLTKMGYKCPTTNLVICKDFQTTFSELNTIIKRYSYPFIVKPNNKSQGQMVYKINNESELFLAFGELFSKNNEFLVQEFCRGNDYRVVVLGNKILQAYQRIPFTIEGDGRKTIETILHERKSLYEKEGRDTVLDIYDKRIIKSLTAKKYSLNTILANGEKLKLQDISNLSVGGTSVDITKSISPYFYNLCVEISKQLNMNMCGIDIFCEDLTDLNCYDYNILEVNSSPGLDNYLYNDISTEKQQAYVEGLYEEILDYLRQIS